MTAVFGTIEEFDSKKEEWPEYAERLSHFFIANGIEGDEKKRAVLLTVIGASTYKTLRSLVHPAKPGEKTYDELLSELTKHFKPAPSEIVQRFKFHTRFRQSGETVAQYVAALRAQAEYCNFGATLEVMLRDRIVCGINHARIQNRLLSETTLTYQRALELAQNQQTVAQNLKELQKGGGKLPVLQEDTDKPPGVLKVSSATGSGSGQDKCGSGSGEK